MKHRAALALTAVVVLGAAGCASDSGSDTEGDPVPTVVATTTIWGSIAEQIVSCAGTGSAVTLMPVGADPHDYEASSTDVATMMAADLVVANGLGLEGDLLTALESAEQDGATILEVGPALDPLPLDGDHSDDEHADDEHGDLDPHVWMDMGRAATAAGLIGEQLAEETGQADYAECGAQVAADIAATEEQVTATLAAVPAPDRILVTDHDSLEYFADAYGFDVVGVVIPGGSTLAEPSSAELAALTEVIATTGAPAIFVNTASPTDLADALAAEVGDVAVVPLDVGSVGAPGSAAATYQGMMIGNAAAIAGALA